ncbi:DNA polymerase III [Candidatus Pacearchaeota archaeon]|nr:DNA polymerase III [Candidatus Pacearchaeota archaeon]|tara:strand:- start:223 stop:798 length:576 start_codon:yes stop_codon:yes gene_type:complete
MGKNKRRHKIINVIDVESTCWETGASKNQTSEIIEIGVCCLHLDTFEITNKKSILLKPIKSSISTFCTELTTLTQDLINEQGVNYIEAIDILKYEYFTKSRMWASWGDYDRKMFERMQKIYPFKSNLYPFGPRHMNVKSLFALLCNNGYECGMPNGLKYFNLPLEGTHHRGHDDAENIAKILRKIIETCKL